MEDLVIASTNHSKIREMKSLLKEMPFSIVSLSAFKDITPAVEDGKTFRENAIKKATLVANATGNLTLADDSGLVVDALGGAPGVYSSRYAGENATDVENNKKLLKELVDVATDRRTASFRCAIAVALPDRLIGVVDGACEGMIIEQGRGNNGFGYDPLFLRLEYNKTFAELSPDVKNKVSHRARALEKAIFLLDRYLKEKMVS